MRITLDFQSDQEVNLPIHYNNILQAFLYKNLSDKDYQKFIHGTGYQIDNKKFKLFTFSKLLGKFKIHSDRGQISFYPPIKLVISSAVEQFITDLAETLIKTDNINLGKNILQIASVSVHRNINLPEKVQIKMLSPMLAYSTTQQEDKKTTNYYSPWQKAFVDIVHNNLLDKYELIYGQRLPNSEFSLIPNGSQENKFKKIIEYKGTYIVAYSGIYWLKADPDLIKVAYDAGLGSKNSQGFGCWEVVG